MKNLFQIIIITSLLFTCPLLAEPQSDPPLNPLPLTTSLIERQTKRTQLTKTDQLMAVLGIKPGMVILDIGAGSGQYTYKFAQHLKGTGKIFATDIHKDKIDYIKQQSQKMGFNNIYPILVKAEGVDPFYSQNRYDMIFIAHTTAFIHDLQNYLKEMRKYLTPKGRLVILATKKIDPFNIEDITDIKGMLQAITKKPLEAPFNKYLKQFRSEAIKALKTNNVTLNFKDRLIKKFNEMLYEHYFYTNFLQDKKLSFKNDLNLSPEEMDYINMKLLELKEEGVVDQNGKINPQHKINEYMFLKTCPPLINQTLIIQKFRKYLFGEIPPFLPKGKLSLSSKKAEKIFIISGYKLEKEYTFIPFELLTVYSPE